MRMNKTFNSDGYCDPELHYMVDISSRLEEIKDMIDTEKYFTVNRARQYGKTTILFALTDCLYNRFLSNYEEQNSDINKGSEGKKSVIRSYSMSIRKAKTEDLSRIAEIFVFNNRMNFFPIFKDEGFSFSELQVVPLIDNYFKKGEIINNICVFDDGIIRGFIQMNETEICKLYVDTFFQSKGVGGRLMEYAIKELHGDHLWALEKNTRAIMFYQRHGFSLTGERKYEEGTTEYLVELAHHRKND